MIVYTMTGYGHWIKEVKEHGKVVVLEDGSHWEIFPMNTVDTCIWLPGTDIIVEDGDHPKYTYKLINTDNNEKVNAKYLSRR